MPRFTPFGRRALTWASARPWGSILHLYGRGKRLWITEYGYQTRPPDRSFGVAYLAQANYVHRAFAAARKTRRIDMLVWFLVRDEHRLSGWQSGVLSTGGKRKPSFQAFQTLRR